MTINDKIKDEKLRNNVNREAVKISTLSSEKKKINMNISQSRNITIWSKKSDRKS